MSRQRRAIDRDVVTGVPIRFAKSDYNRQSKNNPRRRRRRNRGGDYFAMSFRALSGRTLMTLRAGLALNICSCLVKGLIPLRALVAGLLMTMIFIKPGTAKMPGPFLPTAALISPASAS